VISHDCEIGDYANISPGALLAGDVTIGERTLIGMGVTINLGVTIGAGVRIGNGATVKEDVPTGYIVRAGSIWPEQHNRD
jgi:acetyltransferase-like isoleucine patch superfamily enzyme